MRFVLLFGFIGGKLEATHTLEILVKSLINKNGLVTYDTSIFVEDGTRYGFTHEGKGGPLTGASRTRGDLRHLALSYYA